MFGIEKLGLPVTGTLGLESASTRIGKTDKVEVDPKVPENISKKFAGRESKASIPSSLSNRAEILVSSGVPQYLSNLVQALFPEAAASGTPRLDSKGTRPGLRDYLHTSVAHGPAREAVLFATQLGGSGEHWSSVANRMGITGPRLRGYLQRAVAQGPATQAILSAMQPGGSGECWSSVADRMGITDPALRHYLSRVRLGD